MHTDPFSKYHPAVNFLYFLGAIAFVVVFQHPAYLIAGCILGGAYFLLLKGRKAWKQFLYFIPVFVVLALINPIFNTRGQTILFFLFGRPYTLQALWYGIAVAGVFVGMLLWFGCYNVVLTSDKFTALFGAKLPSLSLLLVMVLRLIPNFTRKAKQILDARNAIGMGIDSGTRKQKVRSGLTALSALTTWALEGSITTADSMRSRGYGSGKRTSFQLYKMELRDYMMLCVLLILAGITLASSLSGSTAVTFIPVFQATPISGFYSIGFISYCIYLLIPTILYGKEALQWQIFKSKI